MNNTNPEYSQVRAMLAITRASLRSIFRNKSAVIFTIAFPLVFIVVFGFIRGNRMVLDVGIHPECDTSNAVYQAFRRVPALRIQQMHSQDEITSAISKGRIDAVVWIHHRTSSSGPLIVEILKSEAGREKGSFVVSVLSNIVDKQNIANLQAKTARPEAENEQLAMLKETSVSSREYKMIDFILPGQLGFSILSAGVFGTAFVFFSLRQTLVLKRFFATPIRRTFIVLGEAISRLIFQLIGATIIILLGRFIFGFTLVKGVETLITMLLLSALGLVIFMGFGFVVSGIAKSETVIPPLANMVTLPQFLLSGTFFSNEVFPPWLKSISNALPLTHLNDALRKVAFEGAGFADIRTHILVLLAWGIVVYFAAVKFFRWE